MTASSAQIAVEPVLAEQQVPDEEASQAGMVRASRDAVFGFYSAAKIYSPMLKQGLDLVENQIPEPWFEHLNKMSDPVITNLDSQIDTIKKTVSDKVINPVNNNVIVPAHQSYLALDADQDGSVSLSDFKVSVTQKAGEKVGQWKSLRGDLTKKAVDRMERGMGQVREFSATRGKEMIHLDLIAYSETVLINATTAAKPIFEPLQQKLAASVLELHKAVGSLQELVVTQSAQSMEQVAASRAELHQRLLSAMQAARELSHTSVQFVQSRYQSLEANLEARFPGLSKQAAEALGFILASPAMFAEQVQLGLSSHLPASKITIANANDLLTALRVVVFGAVQAEPEAEAEEEVAALVAAAQEVVAAKEKEVVASMEEEEVQEDEAAEARVGA